MYFEIENTPENIKKARKKELVQEDVQEECARLVLAPFCKPPQVVFDNVLIGTTCIKTLEVFNPSKNAQQITLGKSLPPGLIIHLPGEYLNIDPEICYCVKMAWTPNQPTALRETIRFTNDNRGRYDVIVVLKSVTNIKSKSRQGNRKVSPGKIQKKSGKKSPVAIHKKKIEIISNETVNKTVNLVQPTYFKLGYPTNKENIHATYNHSNDINFQKCPFDSPTSLDFNSSEVFSNVLRQNRNKLYETYDKSYKIIGDEKSQPLHKNVLKPANIQDTSASDIFDNLTFTPHKSTSTKNEKLNRGPKIIISLNSESDFDNSLDVKDDNKENVMHSFTSVTSLQQSFKLPNTIYSVQCTETPVLITKKIPNTSSPKDVNSPNFSINTDCSRISDMSFFPQRFSTERKMLPKKNNETLDIVDDSNLNPKLSSDTYTKESPVTSLDYNINYDTRNFGPFVKDQYTKMCRQSLFKEQQTHRQLIESNYLPTPEHNPWHYDLRADVRSPPRSITPPLQSIPEESIQLSDTQILDKTDKQIATFTINHTFDKTSDRFSMPLNRRSSWSKKAVRAEPTLWKTPVPLTKKITRSKITVKKKESLCNKSNESINQNSILNYVENVYSQSFTVDPFLSSTYFYDKDAVENFETEFKRWLNCILTPPADLDSNVEQQIDVGKAWLENRNKEVPLAPTKERVCSLYHNSHRLESLRRSARALLRSSDISQVTMKLSAQIDKKLIAMRNDRNLHLDIGLQKVVMEILLSYNPLWLRIGLEATYGVILPLKSNNDIEGLTTFVIQRLFKNPNLKNKNSKGSIPNVLAPAYMEAIKRFTLKKFFILIFFLDQAKQKKLIPHDPCLFRRNALCKESKEIIIRFTRELIAGIGDITRHLRPLGYVVSHKQTYLDEYIYAVNNIAVDIRDGVRLTKVMEIILMRNGLLHQLRTPAISRLQKIHNVQVALNALKEAKFVIVGDISAADIADGHREKTLSLLWQLIHVFRAPLFEKAANIIQTWWKKKYAVIAEKKRQEEKIRTERNSAATIIQYWWRRTQYNRMVEIQMQKITSSTTVIQKYCRMWLCRSRFKRFKRSAIKIAEWYRNMKTIREAKGTLQALRLRREKLRHESAKIIQTHYRRWVCMREYKKLKTKIVLVQCIVRRFLVQQRYRRLKKSAIYVQRKFRAKQMMRKQVKNYIEKKNSAIRIQSYYRMSKQRKYYKALKKSVLTVEKYYCTLILMRIDREYYMKLKQATIKIQASYRSKIVRKEYLQQLYLIVRVQRKIRANQAMRRDRANFLKIRNATTVIQKHIKAYQSMVSARRQYVSKRNAAILIQRYYRSYLQKKCQRIKYLLLKKSVIQVQTRFRSLLAMRYERNAYIKLRNSVLSIQRRYRALILMRQCKNKYEEIRRAALVLQRRYRALMEMRETRLKYITMKSACITIQDAYRAHLKMKYHRQIYLEQKKSAIIIQNWYRSIQKTKKIKRQFQLKKKACVVIQEKYKAYIIGRKQRQEYIKIKSAAVCIQKYYKSYTLMKTTRNKFLEIKKSTVIIQRFYRSWVETRKQLQTYVNIRQSAVLIQNYYRQYKLTRMIKQEFCQLKLATICIQQRYRSIVAMRKYRKSYLTIKQSAIFIQRRFRALQLMRIQRREYLRQRSAIITLQIKFKALYLMKQERNRYMTVLKACRTIQMHYRARVEGVEQRKKYLQLKRATVCLQSRYRAIVNMRRDRQSYLKLMNATLLIQRKFRAHQTMLQLRSQFRKTVLSCIIIQQFYRARLIGHKQRETFCRMRRAVVVIQKRYREFRETKSLRKFYMELRNTTIFIQRRIRAKNIARIKANKTAVHKIETWYISIKQRDECRSKFINIKRKIILLQSLFRAYICRKRYLSIRSAAITIQRYYRYFKLAEDERARYSHTRNSIIKLQALCRRFIERRRFIRLRTTVKTLQAVYRFKKYRVLLQRRRQEAVTCIQKYVRRYLVQSRYKRCRQKLIFIQNLYRGKLVTRLMRCEFLQKRLLVLKLQAAIRGYLVRKDFTHRKETLKKLNEEKRRNWAASKIQALFRGHKARIASGSRVASLRRRWRDGGLRSTQETVKERHEDALDVFRYHMSDMECVIRALKSLELLTEVFPMMYDAIAPSLVRRVYEWMSVMNRSISSVEALKSAGSVLVNFTRYRITGPNIYARDHIETTLKHMWRFSKSDTLLFCILSTYIWLFSKYDDVKQDLTKFLLLPKNHKMLTAIKENVHSMNRTAKNRTKKYATPSKYNSHSMNQSAWDSFNFSIHSKGNNSFTMPAMEPDYGITMAERPKYFKDAMQAITCLYETYGL